MSWQVGSEKLKTQPSHQQPGPSLSHNERLKGVERSAFSSLDWWEDPSENCILIPSSKRKKEASFLSNKSPFQAYIPAFCPSCLSFGICLHSYFSVLHIFCQVRRLSKGLKHVCIATHSLGMLEMCICNPFVFSKKEIACLGDIQRRWICRPLSSRAWGCPQRWLRKMHSRILAIYLFKVRNIFETIYFNIKRMEMR